MAFFLARQAEHDLSFHVRDEGGVVTLLGRDGQWREIIEGGAAFGPTVRADAETLERVATAWLGSFPDTNARLPDVSDGDFFGELS